MTETFEQKLARLAADLKPKKRRTRHESANREGLKRILAARERFHRGTSKP